MHFAASPRPRPAALALSTVPHKFETHEAAPAGPALRCSLVTDLLRIGSSLTPRFGPASAAHWARTFCDAVLRALRDVGYDGWLVVDEETHVIVCIWTTSARAIPVTTPATCRNCSNSWRRSARIARPAVRTPRTAIARWRCTTRSAPRRRKGRGGGALRGRV